jgi:virulence-associated protein VapD
MKDIRSFCKLFEINIPEYSQFEYYIDQLSKLDKYKNIKELVEKFRTLESEIDDIYQFKVKKSNDIIEFIKTTRAFSELNDDNLIPDYPTTKNFVYHESKRYLSIDIKQANWTILKRYDPDFLNELGNSYFELLDKFGLPEIFQHSKTFRQFIFGNLNPKRQIKAQRVIIEEIIQKLKSYDLEVACIKHDEIIYVVDDDITLENILSEIDYNIFKIKIYRVERVEDFRINSYYDQSENFLHKELVGCNAHLYYLNLKRFIFREKIDIRDLYFRLDSKLAIWNYDGLKLELI